MWSLAGPEDRFGLPPGRLAELDPAGLHGVVRRAIRGWDPALRELVALAEVPDTFLLRVRSAAPVEPWEPGRVTVLGDAIHAMSPARGSGANTALQDAALLGRRGRRPGGGPRGPPPPGARGGGRGFTARRHNQSPGGPIKIPKPPR
ncbi:FAD-dependent oxidoreductase, partial [Kitasatospora sp. NPDC006697]|uniref:FAD-dependent oxidoreductase n=1 Tax=Kitasatospora sp. NPDC006697 TaxID=3364020 RepID=UPI00368B2928